MTKKKALFLCSQNCALSPMAAAWANRLFWRDLHAESAGFDVRPPDPLATRVMRETGTELAWHPTRSVVEAFVACRSFDYVVTLEDALLRRSLPTNASVDERLHWSTRPLKLAKGSVAEQVRFAREIRDELLQRVVAWGMSLGFEPDWAALIYTPVQSTRRAGYSLPRQTAMLLTSRGTIWPEHSEPQSWSWN